MHVRRVSNLRVAAPSYGTVARFFSQLRRLRWHGLQGILAHVQSPAGTDVGASVALVGALDVSCSGGIVAD